MKIEKINENKIKITLSLNDLEERNIDLESLNINSPATQELFWDMMEQAEIELGFNASDSQLCIEAVPDSQDGFIITITKLDEDGDFESIHKYIKNRFRKSDLSVKKKSRKVCSTISVYSFKDFDDICALSKTVNSIYSGESTLYRLKNVYYLILTKNALNTTDVKKFDALLDEYGSKVSDVNFYEGYLNEHGTKLIEFNAFETIRSYF
jgi:adapter protein MecA 1/2